MEYSETLTPEHFIHRKAKEQVEMNLLENKEDENLIDNESYPELLEENEEELKQCSASKPNEG